VVHTKVLAVDDGFVSIGSYNFDHRSLAYNLEVVVNVLDPHYCAEAKQMLEDDMGINTELTLATYERRSWFSRLLERLAYSFRKWL
jgi:cardiolipin synthase